MKPTFIGGLYGDGLVYKVEDKLDLMIEASIQFDWGYFLDENGHIDKMLSWPDRREVVRGYDKEPLKLDEENE
jgi:hypothetical protein